ncbi:MAG: serine hydrolase [Pseudomonadota bacterium]
MAYTEPLIDLPSHPKDTAWPTEAWPEGKLGAGVDAAPLDQLIMRALSNPDDLGETHAVLVIQGGQIVCEAYGEGFGPEKTYPSWSMAKSITHALVGMAIADGKMTLEAPVGLPEWQGDGRREITLQHLLQMASGLRFREDYVDAGVSDTIEMLFGPGKPDVAQYAIDQVLEHPPGTFWSYSSGTTNIICRLLADALGLDCDGMEAFMRARLFAPVGMRSPLPKFDEAGTFIGSSFCYCTARDFARFGLLYLRGGQWDGAQLLSPAWVDHARTPLACVPEDEPMGYGGHWWLGLAGPGSFSANGYQGQYIVLVPEKDLIIVRHGASEDQKDNVRDWLAALAACF